MKGLKKDLLLSFLQIFHLKKLRNYIEKELNQEFIIENKNMDYLLSPFHEKKKGKKTLIK
jgi:hypothetical protein